MINNLTSIEYKQKNLLIFVKVLFWLIFIVFIFYVGLSIFKQDSVIKVFKFQPYVIQSGSMDPTIKFGDIVIVTEIDDIDNLQKTDIITFKTDINLDGKKEVVTHYYVKTEIDDNGNKYIRTKREGTNTLDSWKVEEKDIIGKYILHLPKAGKFILFLKDGIGIRVLIIDIVIIFLIVILSKYENEEEKNMN